MSNKKQHHEEHVDETWLIPYADMLTLLLALFIVMFAMSNTDKEKMRRMSQQFSVIFSGGSALLESSSESPAANSSSMSIVADNVIEQDKMNQVKRALEEEFKEKGYADQVKIELNNEGLEVAIQAAALFNSGDANVLPDVYPLLTQISKTISSLNNNIKIAGHTDNMPISTDKFRSNWDLSAMRAINIMNYMVSNGSLHAEKVSVQAYGEYSPKYDNSTEEGRAKNRRVEIFIIRKYPINTSQTGDTTSKNESTNKSETKTGDSSKANLQNVIQSKIESEMPK